MPNPPRPHTGKHAAPSRVTPRLIALALAGTLSVGVGAAATLDPSQPAPRQVELAVQKAPVTAPLVATAPTASPSAVPAPVVKPRPAAPKRVTRTKPAARWLPSGTGMWLHEYDRSAGGSGRAIVGRARAAGLSVLYVQTGSTKKGWIGTPTLRSILPATKGTRIKVVAWDFPTLHDPVADARRLARAATFHCGGCPRVAAVAPDVETFAEGTRISDRRAAQYYAALRRLLPRNVAILATVPWPSEKRVGKYPYARTAAYSDAIIPMVYWYNRDPGQVTAASMAYLARFRKPVMPVGQGYDGRLDAPYIPRDTDPFGSVQAFLRVAKARGAKHVSLWSWQTTGAQQWSALSRAHRQYPTTPV